MADTKSQVQGVVLALFGANAGAYLSDLTAQATAGSVAGVANGLTSGGKVSLQSMVLGKDMSVQATWVDWMLGNMGVTSLSTVYKDAAAWANALLTAGASRGDVVTAAVNFLMGIADGTIVDAKYTTLGKAFATKVEAGVKYSETAAGAKEFGIAALQTAAGGVTANINLSEALVKLAATNKAVEDYLKALDTDLNGKADGVDGLSSATIKTNIGNAVSTAEAKVKALFDTTANNFEAGKVAVASYDDYDATGETSYNTSKDATEDAALAANRALLTVDRSAKAALVTAKGTALGANKTLVDAVMASQDAYVSAAAVNTKADNDFTAAGNAYIAANTTVSAGATTAPANVSVSVNTSTSVVTLTINSVTASTFNGTSWSDVAGLTYSATAELKAAALAVLSTQQAEERALELVATRLTALETANTGLAGTTNSSADTFAASGGYTSVDRTKLIGAAGDYRDAIDALALFDKNNATLTKVEAEVTAARTTAKSLVALEKAVTTAETVITDAGYALKTLDSSTAYAASTTKADVIAVSGLLNSTTAAQVTGFAKGDVLVLTGYSKATTTTGDNAKLEYKVEKVGLDTVLTFESKAFGFDSTQEGEFTVKLVGVDPATLVENGDLLIGGI